MTGRPDGRSGSGPRAGEILGLAAVFGLTLGLLEVALRGLQRYVLGARLFLSPDVVWMAPLADVALFVLVGVALLLLRRLGAALKPGSNVIGYAAVFATFMFLVPLGPLLSTPRIHPLASVLLTLGVAVQGGRILARRLPSVRVLAKRAAPLMALAVLIGAAVVRAGPWLQERRLTSGLPEPQPEAPNVLLLILDTVRAADMSLYGYEKPTTPHLERLATRGITFERAVSTSPWTLPSHGSMFTGRYPHELSADWETPLDDADLTLAEYFTAHGYRAAGFVGNLIYATWETGLQRGFARYEDYPVSVAMIANSSLLTRWLVNRTRWFLGRDQFLVWKSAGDINDAFLDWLGAPMESPGDPERPFFAFLNYMDAHAPYLPPDSLVGRFGPVRSGRALADLSDRRDWSAKELAAERAAYDGVIAYLDQQIGALVAELEGRGILDNTLLIVSSDHGELLGEHGLVDHGNSLYRPLLDVPLLLVFPRRVPEGGRVAEPVTLRDLTATIADLATEEEAAFPGTSLAGSWREGTDASPRSPILSSVSGGVRMPEWVPISKGDMSSLVAGGYQYIIDGTGREELYRYAPAGAEEVDLAASPAEAERLEAMRRALRSLTARE